MTKHLKVVTEDGKITFLPVSAKQYIETLAKTKGQKVKTEIITQQEMEELIESGELVDLSFKNVAASEVMVAKAEIESLTEVNAEQSKTIEEMQKKIAELEKANAKAQKASASEKGDK